MAKSYPIFQRSRDAECFKCYGTLTDCSRSGSAPGDGAFVGHCEGCRTRTWFDMPEEETE